MEEIHQILKIQVISDKTSPNVWLQISISLYLQRLKNKDFLLPQWNTPKMAIFQSSIVDLLQ